MISWLLKKIKDVSNDQKLNKVFNKIRVASRSRPFDQKLTALKTLYLTAGDFTISIERQTRGDLVMIWKDRSPILSGVDQHHQYDGLLGHNDVSWHPEALNQLFKIRDQIKPAEVQSFSCIHGPVKYAFCEKCDSRFRR